MPVVVPGVGQDRYGIGDQRGRLLVHGVVVPLSVEGSVGDDGQGAIQRGPVLHSNRRMDPVRGHVAADPAGVEVDIHDLQICRQLGDIQLQEIDIMSFPLVVEGLPAELHRFITRGDLVRRVRDDIADRLGRQLFHGRIDVQVGEPGVFAFPDDGRVGGVTRPDQLARRHTVG